MPTELSEFVFVVYMRVAYIHSSGPKASTCLWSFWPANLLQEPQDFILSECTKPNHSITPSNPITLFNSLSPALSHTLTSPITSQAQTAERTSAASAMQRLNKHIWPSSPAGRKRAGFPQILCSFKPTVAHRILFWNNAKSEFLWN